MSASSSAFLLCLQLSHAFQTTRYEVLSTAYTYHEKIQQSDQPLLVAYMDSETSDTFSDTGVFALAADGFHCIAEIYVAFTSSDDIVTPAHVKEGAGPSLSLFESGTRHRGHSSVFHQ